MKLRWKITIGVAVLIVIAGIFFGTRENDTQIKMAVVEKRDVTQEVLFTGRLTSKHMARMAFESSGTVSSISVEVGDKVKAGQELVRLDNRASTLELAAARADLAAETDRANQAWRNAGLATQKTKTESTRTLDVRRQSVRDSKKEMDQAHLVWEQTVRESGDESALAKAKYAGFLAAQTAYRASQQALLASQATVAKTNQVAVADEDEAYTAYLATQQASATLSGLSSGQAAQALANLRVVKNIAIAPFDGVVTAKTVSVGEVAVAGSSVVTIETVDQLEIVADVPESDITKLENGMGGLFTLDAFSDNRTLKARIIKIAPSAKVLEGVPTYEVTLEVAGGETPIRSGMTTNVTIISAEKKGVVAIPRRAVVRTGGAYKVRVLRDEDVIEEKEVALGVLGTDGYVEVLDGLKAGENIIVSQEAP